VEAEQFEAPNGLEWARGETAAGDATGEEISIAIKMNPLFPRMFLLLTFSQMEALISNGGGVLCKLFCSAFSVTYQRVPNAPVGGGMTYRDQGRLYRPWGSDDIGSASSCKILHCSSV